MSEFTKALSVLEFDKIREMLANHAQTDGAREKAMSIMPETDIARITLRISQTSEAKRLSDMKGSPSFYGVHDIRGAVDRAEKGASLTPHELLDCATVLRCARNLVDYNNSDKTRTERGALDIFFERLTTNRSLENKISTAIPAPELIADEASSALADIRRKMRNANNRIKDSLQRFISAGSYSKYLQENIITMRNGRYVIPVKSECKNEIKGLVHDTSASGATLFIEPAAVVDANNELRILENEEKIEIEKILAALSMLVAASGNDISGDYYSITEISFAFAKAELSHEMKASEPSFSDDSNRSLSLSRARHPLLSRNTVVPIDIRLGGDFDTLVITGPNTGGKTVTLKTLGLFSLMAQSGLHIPADDSSRLPIFDSIYADIGDEQSIEQSLSTFSAHMTNIVSFIHKLTSHSLVLFDELGAGTDPTEGAALAMAILESVRKTGALCAATTHYAELKAFALETDGVCNACCEFDVATLEPTYRLIIGSPGKSNAFAISEKLGLGSDIVALAREHVSNDERRFENVIEKLEESRIQMEKHRDEARRERDTAAKLLADTQKQIELQKSSAEKELDSAKREAYRIVKSAKASSDYVMEKLEEARKKQESLSSRKNLDDAKRDIRRTLGEADDVIDPVISRSNEGYVLPRALVAGDEVLIVNINKRGVVMSAADKSGNIQIKSGSFITRTKLSNLQLLDDSHHETKKAPAGPSSYEKAMHKSFSPELDVRGEIGDDAWERCDKYIDDAMLVRMQSIRVIHGKGTGALRRRLWDELKADARVKSYRLGEYGEGDTGVTIVELKV